MTDLCPTCNRPMPLPPDQIPPDNRANDWRLRLRLYESGAGEPVADSDPDLPPDQPGTIICRGLTAVADYLRDTATAFHTGANDHPGLTITGLDSATLARRIKGLRPTLSRRGGDAVFRVAYATPGHEWSARIDIEKA